MSWLLRLAVVSLVAMHAARAAEAPDTHIALVFKPAPTLPSDEELERLGARIGLIRIQVDDVFENQDDLSVPYRLANRLHFSTREKTVEHQLLFRHGVRFSRRLLQENERLLREQRYLNDAKIEVLRYNADNTVDVLVRVHDVWTLSPGFSFGRKGGENTTRMEFEDTNFLGRGKQLSFGRSSNVDRTAWRLAYTDPNLFGSWWKLSAAHSSLSDGSQNAVEFGRPFYSLDTRWSVGFAVSDSISAISRYALGKTVEKFDAQRRLLEIEGGLSAGLRDGWVKRYLTGIRYDAQAFRARPDEPLASLPMDRTLAYPWIGFELIEDAYITTHNLNQIGRTEDLHLGRSARFELGWASTAFGSTNNAAMLNTELRTGRDIGHSQYWVNGLTLGGRLENGGITNGLMALQSQYYYRQSPAWVFFAGLTAAFASNSDPETQLLLGGENGLRGYPLRYQGGTASTLIALEERFYTHWQLLKLFNVGAAVFFDAGRTWGQDEFAGTSMGWLKDVGVGLRLGSARSSLGNVLHIDLAFPLDGGKNIDSMQLLLQTRRSF
jgi:hypothetical protein